LDNIAFKISIEKTLSAYYSEIVIADSESLKNIRSFNLNLDIGLCDRDKEISSED
jgi:hypothetical protein